jgi:hypothetical protein
MNEAIQGLFDLKGSGYPVSFVDKVVSMDQRVIMTALEAYYWGSSLFSEHCEVSLPINEVY